MDRQGFQPFLTQLEGLSGSQRQEVMERLEELIQHADSERLGTPTACPNCGATEVVRYGQANGRQRYRCKDCRRTFIGLTGTPLMGLREPRKLLAYAQCLSEGLTIRESARRVELTVDRSFRWRHKFLQWIAEHKPQGLTGVVEADETYFAKSYKGQRKALPRPPRQRGGARKARWSKRQTQADSEMVDEPPVPVMSAMQRGSRLTHDAILAARDAQALTQALRPALGADAIVASDGNPGYGVAARALGIKSGSFVARYHGPGGDGVWHVQNLNAYHARLKAWMARFHGVATKYLHHYLGWRRLLDRYHDGVTGEQVLFHALRQVAYQHTIRT